MIFAFGSRQRPRRSIPDGELAAGSYVELHGGPYISQEYHLVARGSDYHGILVSRYSEYTWILENEIYNNGGDAIQVGGTNFQRDVRPQFVYIARNRMYGNRENAVDIKRDIRNRLPAWEPNSGYAGGAAMHFRGNSSGGAIGNTIARYDIGLQLTQGGKAGYIVQNNLFAFRLAAAGDDIYVASGGTGNRRGHVLQRRGKIPGALRDRSWP